jgi:pimeloyl-ACP methyl ester carboxylesterase
MNPPTKGHPMQAPPTRVFTPARIAALTLIAVLAGGLAYLRFAPDSDQVSVPKGAKAGDVFLESCDYATENGTYAADCGTLVVRENRADPQSRLIALPVTRIKARSESPAEPIFRLEGGPGKTNMEFENASRFAEDRDVVLVGYRGVDGSVRLDCPEVESTLGHTKGVLGGKFFRAYGDGLRECAERHSDDGVDLSVYSLVQQVDDLEDARVALGYDRIDLVSESAGTRTALIYSWRYPKSIHRSVLIAANPPGHFLWDAETTDEQIARYAAYCAKDDDCSRRTDDLAGSLRRAGDDPRDRWLFLPVEEDNVRAASFFGLMEASSEAAPLNGPLTLDSWLSAEERDPSGFWFQSLLGDLAFPKMTVWGQRAAAARLDARAARDYFSSGAQVGSNLGFDATAFVWAGGRLADAWPAAQEENRYSRMRTSKTETLVVGGELDFTTPPQVATKELLPYLPNGHQVVLEGFGHTVDFWSQQPEAGTRLINTFLDSGRVDESGYEPQRVDFTPAMTYGALAKILLGSMLSLAALAVLSLAWMARRVHRRGRFGRKAGVALRTLYPVVLGLGGWAAGVLVTLTAFPGTPLDNALLSVLSVGAPVGLGVYYGWAGRDRNRTAGIVAATTGALLGGWLGFHATADLAALLTTIAGAVAGANLLLLALDIVRDRSAREAAAVAPAGAAAPAEA